VIVLQDGDVGRKGIQILEFWHELQAFGFDCAVLL